MGSSSSRLSSAPGSAGAGAGAGGDRPNFRFASLLCGTSFTDDPPCQIEDQSSDIATPPVVDDEQQNSVKDPSLTVTEGKNSFLSTQGASLGQSSYLAEKDVNSSSSSAETSNSTKHSSDGKMVVTSNSDNHFSKSKELPHCTKDADNCFNDTYSGRIGDQQFPLMKTLPFGSSSITRETISAPMVEGDGSAIGPGPEIRSEGFCLSDLPQQEHECFSSSEASSPGIQVAEPSRDEPVRETTSLGSGFHRAIVHGDRRSVLHVDVVSISSDILTSSRNDVSNHEARRNSRRLFWDAFSRRSSRRDDDIRSVILSAEGSDDLGSRGRWLLDFNNDSDSFENGVGNEARSLNSRRHGAYEHRRRSRSELWERFRGGLDESNGNATLCASGLHPEGTCSCESLLMAEISSARASISRIVLLAEALFEVLDEIHRQPDSLSFSMMSHPAQESVVNSFPLKNYKKSDMLGSGEDVEQCYICLAEYEEEDVIRILPCQHEYHMPCVDKWLKEIHGVCPLCRRDVCDGVVDSPASSS